MSYNWVISMGLYTLFLWVTSVLVISCLIRAITVDILLANDIPIHLPRFSMGFYAFPMTMEYPDVFGNLRHDAPRSTARPRVSPSLSRHPRPRS